MLHGYEQIAQPQVPSVAGRVRLPWLLNAALAVASLWTMLAAVAPAQAEPTARRNEKRTVLSYQSTLKDDENKPVAGIFPMQFALSKGKSKKPFWTEKHWIAVDNGHYSVQLGRTVALPKDLDPKTAVIAISVTGFGEILREALAGGDAAVGEEVALGGAGNGGKRIVQYAEKAGFSYEAEHAVTADRLGNFTAKLLQDALDELQKRKLKVKVGRNQINLTTIGGAGGTPFESICPAGMVSVGIRGGSGIYIDNFQVVCAPLE
jgi:hypothetical protein